MDPIPTRASMRLKFGLAALLAATTVLALVAAGIHGNGKYWLAVGFGCVGTAGFLATALLDRHYLNLAMERANLEP